MPLGLGMFLLGHENEESPIRIGLPVIAYNWGSVPEVIEEGVTGFIVNDFDEAVAAAKKAGTLSRRRCRQLFEERFTTERMVKEYVKIYEKVIKMKKDSPLPTSGLMNPNIYLNPGPTNLKK